MEPTNVSNRPCPSQGLFIKDRKQDQVELRFNNLYYTVSLGIGKGESLKFLFFFKRINANILRMYVTLQVNGPALEFFFARQHAYA